MKKFYLFLFFVSSLFSGFSQTQITLTFIGKDSLTQNLISLDSVFVKNLTENCDTTLYDAASILYLDAFWPVGIGENNISSSGSFVLKQNYPNPFQGSTFVNIYREYGGSLNLILFDELGTKLATYQNDFVKGFHSFVVSSSGNKVLFLVVFDDKNNRSIKIISTGQSNETNSIRYLEYSPNVDKGSLKILDNSGFIFYLGNQLMYTAYVNGYNDKTITDSPITNTNYTFLMAPAGTPPSVTTTLVTNITQTTATSGGNVTADGGYPIITRGVCWSTSPNPTIANSYTVDGSGLGSFVSSLAGLAPSTTYYIRAYATNGVGTGYGNELSFITLQNITLATVTTAVITNITQTTATSGGNVTSDGGATVTARGVCWSTTPSPTIANSHTVDGSGLGSFISNLTGLSPNTLYYVCAYATNSVGTAYGNENSFTTGQTITPPSVTTTVVTNITQTTATSGGNVTSDGGATVSSRGVCWSTSTSPTIAGSHTTDGTGTGSFVSNITVLTGGTLYYIRAYATNSAGTSYGNELTFTTLSFPTVTTNTVTNITQSTATSGGNVTADGGATVTARGVCWSTSALPTIAGAHTTDGSGVGSFVSSITGLAGGTLYYVRAYATNSIGTSYGNELTFTPLNFPTVTTTSVTNITQTTATSGGNVTSDGGTTVTARGVCWSITSSPLVTGNHTTDGTGTGTFVSSITGLAGGTLYYVRAYATNSVGTAYGNELTFTTLNLPTVATAIVINITSTSATSGGTVTSSGGASVTARGVCWSISPSPTIAGNHTTDGTGVGTYVSNITGLTGGTIYYIRAYATNSVGTSYGNELSFTTIGNWVVQNSGTIYGLQSVYFTDANTGYAVGLLGTILKTTNGGTNWAHQTSGTLENLYSVYFPNATTGYVVGTSGTILKTTNGGTNWSPQTSGTSDSLMSVHFPDVNTGYIAFGFILKTTNGGTTWIQEPIIPMMPSAVYFTNLSTGYTIGWTGNSGPIIKTIDGGTNWTTQFSSAEQLQSVYFPTVDSGYVVGISSTILKTTNGGTNWTPQTSGGPLENLYSVYFPNATTGFVVGTSGTILKTTNGGTNWTHQTSGTTNNLNSVHFIGVNIGYAVGDNGTILKTTNGGG